MAYSKAANHASVAQATKSAASLMPCREDDARSTSASSGQGDGGSDIHAISSDEEQEIALKQSELVQHQNVLANVPCRREKQRRQQRQQQQQQCNDTSNKAEQLCAPPGLQRPATTVGGKAAPATLQACAFRPPPGLPPPPGLVEPPPGMLFPAVKPFVVVSDCNEGLPAAFKYTVHAFRRELANIMRELRLHKNPGLAVSQVRICGVPQDRQAAEFVDILTRSAEESRGPARRTFMAFVGGLTRAFKKEECIAGLCMFFDEVYPDLYSEIPRLPQIVITELMPTLKSVLDAGELRVLQPSLIGAVGTYAA